MYNCMSSPLVYTTSISEFDTHSIKNTRQLHSTICESWIHSCIGCCIIAYIWRLNCQNMFVSTISPTGSYIT